MLRHVFRRLLMFSSALLGSLFTENFLTLSQTTIFRTSKLKEFADDNFKFDENGRKFSRWIENTVGKGEIARYEQLLSVFKRLVLQTRENQCLFGKELRGFFVISFQCCPALKMTQLLIG